jgi:hypothetical protein
MSRWWICRMRQRARHQPRRNNCQHWVVVATHSVWCTKSNHLWNARKQIRTFLELNKAVLAWLGREKKIELQFTVIKSEEEEEKPREGSSDQTVLFWCQSFSISFVSAAAIVHEADRTDSTVLGAGLVFSPRQIKTVFRVVFHSTRNRIASSCTKNPVENRGTTSAATRNHPLVQHSSGLFISKNITHSLVTTLWKKI